MKQEIKNNELQERQGYVPASVKVINITAHGVLCASGILEDYTNEDDPNWFGIL